MELLQASHQWATRPADQRFTSLIDLNEHCQHRHAHSHAQCVGSRSITAAPLESDHKALIVVAPNGAPVNVTHWAFGQLAQRAKAPAGYLRDLPAALAADCINYGMQFNRDVEDLGLLLYKNGGAPELSAVTGPNYGRIWNSTITKELVDRFGDGITGAFKVPGEFGQRVEITNQNTTLYASDRDMFVFLADEEHKITVPNRRDGKSGELSRGFFVWNSEVGSQTFGIATFLFDYTCSNRIVWGADGYQEIRIRHTAGAPDKWLSDIMPAIQTYANSSSMGVVKAIEEAKKARIDGTDGALDSFLAKRFSKSQSQAIKAAHMNDEQRPIETMWDVVTGVTAYARGINYQDDRVKLEREAGKILALSNS